MESIGAAHDLDAERAVLTACSMDTNAARSVAHRLHPRHFYLRGHAKVYEAILALVGRGQRPDSVTLCAELKDTGLLDECGGAYAVVSMLESGASPANVLAHATIVRQQWAIRERRRIGQELANGSASDPELAASLATRIAEINLEASGEAPPSPMSGAASWSSSLAPENLIRPISLLGDGVLCRSDLSLIAGAPGLGKSRLTIELGVSIARAEPWLGLPTTAAPGRVVYIAAEFTRYRWVERMLRLMLGHCPDDPETMLDAFRSLETSVSNGLFHGIPGEALKSPINLLDPACADHLVEIVELFEADLLVLDPLSRMMNGMDESNEFLGIVVQTLDKVRFRTGAAVHVVHHVRKGTTTPHAKDDPLDMIRGGTKLRDAINAGMFLSKTPSGLKRLEFPKANYASEPDPIFHRIPDDGGRTIVAESPGDILEGNRKKVLDYVTEHPGCTQSDIGKAVKISDKTIRTHLAYFIEKNEVSSVNGKRRSRDTYFRSGSSSVNDPVTELDNDDWQEVMPIS